MYDRITTSIEQYVTNQMNFLMDLRERDKKCLYSVLDASLYGKKILKSKSEDLLDLAMKHAIELFQQIAELHTFDMWLSLTRRFPLTPLFNPNWVVHTTLGLLRYAKIEPETTIQQIQVSKVVTGITLEISDEDISNAFRLVGFGSDIAELLILRRSVSKGMTLYLNEKGRPYVLTSKRVLEAVNHYDRRAPQFALLAYAGIPALPIEQDGPSFYEVRRLPRPLQLYIPDQNLTFFLPSWLTPVNLLETRKLLLHYSEAIEEIFGVHPDSIIAILGTLSALVHSTLPPLEVDEKNKYLILCDAAKNSENDHKLGFLQRLLWTGYLRYPIDQFKKELFSGFTHLTGLPALMSNIDDFFTGFVDTQNLEEFDCITLRPCQFIYTSANGSCYADLMLVEDFLAWVVEEAKSWYSSQHGDRFTLVTKNALIGALGDKAIVSWKKKYISKEGNQVEVDLLVNAKGKLWVVENKALSKSREYWRGDIAAIAQHTNSIRLAVKQAQNASSAVAYNCGKGTLEKFNKRSVEWIVCTPSQEFIFPISKFGMLNKNIPRVCTLNELLQFLC